MIRVGDRAVYINDTWPYLTGGLCTVLSVERGGNLCVQFDDPRYSRPRTVLRQSLKPMDVENVEWMAECSINL